MKLDKLVKRVSEKLNIDNKLAEEICRSQFIFIVDQMKKGDWTPINCIYWGKFVRNKNYDKQGRSIRYSRRFKKLPVEG